MSDTKNKSTIYVGNLADDINEEALIEVFSTFGDVMEVQLPTHDRHQGFFPAAAQVGRPVLPPPPSTEPGKHRGFAFITFGTQTDAQDAVDNMDMNELRGKVLKVNIAKNVKAPVQGAGNRAIWETEEWLKQYGTKATAPGYGAKKGEDNGEEDAEGEDQAGEEDGMEE